MEILSKKENGMGSNFVLVKYTDDFYAHGTEADIKDKYGFPINSCGTKEKVLNHCRSITELCKNNIKNYSEELIKSKSNGWELLIEHEQKELEALIEFINVLTA